ncbi:hypothetical protein [Streptacidiphilus sp. MAP5-52]|uniref:hypothetical protein n=1 Tax=Streptacidiphilus sp. MAP5-52 TaxID=3156267 RepID=UPI00351233C9
MNTLLLWVLAGLTGVAALGTLAWAVTAWHVTRLQARRFAYRVDLLRPASSSADRDWFEDCLARLHDSVDLAVDLTADAPSTVGRAPEGTGQPQRLAAEAERPVGGSPVRAEVAEDGADLGERGPDGGPGPDLDGDFDRVPGDSLGCDVCHANVDTHGHVPREGGGRAGRGGVCCRAQGE